MLGEWSAILLGVAILIGGAFAVSILLAPGLLVAGIGVAALDRGNQVFGWLVLTLSSTWTYIVIIGWEVGIFSLIGKRVNSENIIPMWLWSYGAATGVWSFLASKEQQSGDGGGAATAAFSAQVAYIILAMCSIWLDWPLAQTIIAMSVVLLFPLFLGLLSIAASSRRYA